MNHSDLFFVVVVFGSLLPFERYFCWVWNSDLTGFCYYSATEISFHYPLPCIVSHEKSIVIRMANYDSSPWNVFSLHRLHPFLFVSGFQGAVNIMCLWCDGPFGEGNIYSA